MTVLQTVDDSLADGSGEDGAADGAGRGAEDLLLLAVHVQHLLHHVPEHVRRARGTQSLPVPRARRQPSRTAENWDHNPLHYRSEKRWL